MYFSPHSITRFGSDDGTSPLQSSFAAIGMEHLMQSLSERGLSPDIISCMLKDVEESSINKYQAYWSKFTHWCNSREIYSGNLNVNMICKFLIHMYDTGLSASTLKFVKCSLSFFLRVSHEELLNHSFISRLLKSFEKRRPTVPRYAVTWDVNKVLCFCSNGILIIPYH